MGIKEYTIGTAIAILLAIVLLANKFLTAKQRIGLYLSLMFVALSIGSYTYYNLHLRSSDYAWQPIVTGLQQPVYGIVDARANGRFLIVEREGMIQLVTDGVIGETPFLDIRDRVESSGSEQGLLSIALHPQFVDNGYFYLYYLTAEESVLARYQTNPAGDGDPDSEEIMLTQPQPNSHHNGGLLMIGPDQQLYLGFGDGGEEMEGPNRSQDLTHYLGKMLRLDISDPEKSLYQIPSDNPFNGDSSKKEEIWAWGLRNPWRYSFDQSTGDLYIADVGSTMREEINFQPNGVGSGANYGWRWYEGFRQVNNEGDGEPANDLHFPTAEYDHLALGGCAIIGGYVYRGTDMPELTGQYLFGDYCTGFVWTLTHTNGENGEIQTLFRRPGVGLSSFVQGADGELYSLNISEGMLFKLGKE